MFLQASVILLTGGVPAPGGVCVSQHALRQTAPSPRPDTSPGADTPGPDTLPPPNFFLHPPEADSRIRSTSGRYTSYWNTLLLGLKITLFHKISYFQL